MLIKYSKLSDFRIKKILKCFCLDLTAKQTSELLSINRNTINHYYNVFRQNIYQNQIEALRKFKGNIEVDESYFGPRRLRGRHHPKSKRGRGTHKQPVFGVYERNSHVYTEIIPNCKKRTLHAIIQGKITLKSTIYSDKWRGYDGLVDVGYDKHFRINHKKDEFARARRVHINGIEAFWSFTKRRLAKFNGVKKNFPIHLKECEWRWNKTTMELQKELLKMLSKSRRKKKIF